MELVKILYSKWKMHNLINHPSSLFFFYNCDLYDSVFGRETNQKLVAAAASLTTSKMKNDSISIVNIHANTTFETIIKDPNQKKVF